MTKPTETSTNSWSERVKVFGLTDGEDLNTFILMVEFEEQDFDCSATVLYCANTPQTLIEAGMLLKDFSVRLKATVIETLQRVEELGGNFGLWHNLAGHYLRKFPDGQILAIFERLRRFLEFRLTKRVAA